VAFLWLVIAVLDSPYVLTGSYTDVNTRLGKLPSVERSLAVYDHFPKLFATIQPAKLMFVTIRLDREWWRYSTEERRDSVRETEPTWNQRSPRKCFRVRNSDGETSTNNPLLWIGFRPSFHKERGINNCCKAETRQSLVFSLGIQKSGDFATIKFPKLLFPRS